MRKGISGLPLLEIAITLAIMAIISLILAQRLLYYREQAEKTVFELTLTNIRSGLRLEKAKRLIHGNNFEELNQKNPIIFLQNPLKGYIGEAEQEPDWAQIPAGTWIFAQDKKLLYYKPMMYEHLETTNRIPVLALGIVKTDEIELRVVTYYRWF